SRPTERLLLALAGCTRPRRSLLHESLSRSGRLGRSGLIVADNGSFAPLGRPLAMQDDVVAVLTGIAAPGIAGAVRQSLLHGRGATAEHTASCLVLHGRGDRADKCCALIASGCRVHYVKVPASPQAAAVCQAAWRVGLATGDLPLLDCSDLDEAECLPLVETI